MTKKNTRAFGAALAAFVLLAGNAALAQVPQTPAQRAAQMVQTAGQLRMAVQRMILSGVPAGQVVLHDTAQWSPCMVGKTCVFAPEGGAFMPADLPADPDTDKYGNTWHLAQLSDKVSVQGVGTPAPELTVHRFITRNARGEAICNEINRLLGVAVMGKWALGPASINGTPGLRAACWDNEGSGFYEYYQVLAEG